MTDIAERAGVSQATVSRALQGAPSVKAATRERIKRIAEESGYTPDPLMSAFAGYRRRNRDISKGGRTIAWVSPDLKVSGPNAPESGYHPTITRGARMHAAQIGYRLDFFNDSAALPMEALLRQLYARGYLGVVYHLQRPVTKYPEGLNKFPVMTVDMNGHDLPYHQCMAHWGQLTRLAVSQVLARGYRRLGLVHLDTYVDARRAGHLWWEREKASRLLGRQPEVFTWETRDRALPMHLEQMARFLVWFREEKPDVIVSDNVIVYWWLREAGLSVPQDIAYVNIGIDSTRNKGESRVLSAAVEPLPTVGERVIRYLDTLIRNGERGRPEIPEQILLTGTWQEGDSLPSRTGA